MHTYTLRAANRAATVRGRTTHWCGDQGCTYFWPYSINISFLTLHQPVMNENAENLGLCVSFYRLYVCVHLLLQIK